MTLDLSLYKACIRLVLCQYDIGLEKEPLVEDTLDLEYDT